MYPDINVNQYLSRGVQQGLTAELYLVFWDQIKTKLISGL